VDESAGAAPVATRPTSLTLAAALAGLEALALLVVAVLEVADLTPGRATMGVTTSVFLGAYGVGLLWCAAGLLRLRTWARGPVLMAQLIQLGLAWNVRSSATALSVALSVVAIVALVALVSRASRSALEAS